MRKASELNWDAGNLTKCQKHGVSVDEIEALFSSTPSIGQDESHSDDEDRYTAIGRNRAGRPIFVIFTWRIIDGREVVRPVSARYLHRKEVERYGG